MKIFNAHPNFRLLLFAIIFMLGFNACSHQSAKPTPEEILLVEKYKQKLGKDCSDFRLVSGEFQLRISEIKTLEGDTLSQDNLESGIPEPTPPSIRIWSADISDHFTQIMLNSGSIIPAPDTLFLDIAYGNRILYWNLTNLLNSNSLSISRSFEYLTFDYKPDIDRNAERQSWADIPLSILNKYTLAEQFLEQDEELIDIVFNLLADISDPVGQAEAIYKWVRESMTYVYPPEKRGVRNAIHTLEGDCGQYTALFISMARIAGIPARQQSGFNFYEDNTGAHVWSEIYLPVKGWVPVDATRADGFLHLDNKRVITSIGLNIPLKKSPDWATFENSEIENGKTDFMQMFTLASNGVQAKYSSSRIIHRSVNFP